MPYQPFGSKTLEKANEIANQPQRKRGKRRGPVTAREKLIIAEIVNDAPAQLVSPKQIEQTAGLLRRDEKTIIGVIAQARERLQARAETYVDLHLAATQGAIADGDFDTARKGAMEMIEKISARDSDGKVERIVEVAESQSSSGPRVMIGIALGGMKVRSDASSE